MVPVHPKYSGDNLGMSGILEGSYNSMLVVKLAILVI